MNDNQANFDAATGQSINNPQNNGSNNINNSGSNIDSNKVNVTNNSTEVNVSQTIQQQPIQQQPIQQQSVQQQPVSQNNLQSIATVDQSSEDFINNVQKDTENSISKGEVTKSYFLIILLFIIVFVSIFFLFPILFEKKL